MQTPTLQISAVNRMNPTKCAPGEECDLPDVGDRDRRVVGQRDKGGPSVGNRMWDREKLSVGLRTERRGQERFSC